MRIVAMADRSQFSFLSKFTFIIVCCYFAEVVMGGPGSWSRDLVGLDIRKCLFSCICLAFLAGVLRCRTLKLRDVIVLCSGIGLFVFWMIAMPLIKDTDMSFSAADGTPIFSMFLVTVIFKIYAEHTDLQRAHLYEKISRFVFLLATLSAVLHFVLFCALNIWPDMGFAVLVTLKLIFDNQDTGSIYVGPMPDGSIRVFWISSLFLVFGLYRVIGKLRTERNSRNWLHLLLFVGAILVTQTRSIFLAVPVAFFFGTVVYGWLRFSRIRLFSLSLFLVIVLFLITFIQVTLASTDVMSLIGLAREGSDQERGLQVGPLLQGLLENLWIGGGFGYHVSYIRSEAAPFSYEFSILALYVKLGVLGLALVWAYFLYIGNSLGRSTFPLKALRFEYGSLASLIFVYFFVFNTNPYLSNSVGVAIFLLICVEAARLFKHPLVTSRAGVGR